MQISEIIKRYIISNPLEYQYFYEILIILGIFLAVGAVIVVLFNIKNLGETHKSITFKKLVGWAIMSPTFLISVICGGIPALLLITFIVYKALDEFFKIFFLPRFYFIACFILWIITVITAIASSLPFFTESFGKVIYILPVIYLIIISLISILRGRLEDIMKRVTFSFFALMWICYPMMHFISLSKTIYGKEFLIIIGFSVALSDVLAFCVGKIFDKIGFGTQYKIAENISANKTYAGILGNIIGASIGIFAMSFMIKEVNIIHKIIFVIIIGISSSLGDMIESFVKRSARIKDTSNALIGHGGFLDRIDSLLIVIIAVYYYLFLFTELIK